MAAAPIVIVGGGFAGTTLARRLERILPREAGIVLASEESYTTFNPMLAEVVGASVFPEHVVAPIRQMLARTRFVMGRATGVDLARRTLLVDTLAGRQSIAYGELVLAFGSRANLGLVPGLAAHGLPLKLVGDAMHIRNRLLQRVARIELETDPRTRARLGRFVVIGGAFSGVEVAGAMADFLRSAGRWYPRVLPRELQVTLLEAGDRLLAELPESLARSAQRSLMARGIDVRLGARAAQVDADGVDLDDGTRIESATVVCTIGTRPNPFAHALASAAGLVLQRGRIVTAPDLSVPRAPGVWAIGDCALVADGAATGAMPAFVPPTAQGAVAQAQALARNLVAARAGLPTQRFRYRSRGMMATTGHLKGVAQLGRIRLTGLPAWLLWRAVYLLRMPTFGRKVRIWVEWTWSMAFAADITHLRFTRTADIDAESSTAAGATDAATPRPVRAAAG
jgi:NADH dehydrogenase